MRTQKLVKTWTTKVGYPAAIILNHRDVPEECQLDMASTWHCGYIAIPKEHKLYGISYISFSDIGVHINVHWGITFGAFKDDHEMPKLPDIKDAYWLGFDCDHLGDTIESCNILFCERECESLAEQLKELEELK